MKPMLSALRRHSARSLGLLLVGTALVTGCSRSSSPPGEWVLSGNLEVTDAQVSFKLPGRVSERLVSEGMTVEAGQVVARLEATDQRAELALRRAELAAAEAALAELVAGSRPQEIAAAAATLRSTEAERDRARLDLKRQQELLAQEVIPRRDFEMAEMQARVAEARVNEAHERLKLLQEGPRTETIAQARARLEQAGALVALAEARVGYAELMSPLTGVVLAHHAEAGEFVAAGTPILTVADLARPWVRAYVNQTDLGRIRHGAAVTVKVDSFPDREFPGTIGFIASEAEFTPKSVQTTKERVRLVFRVKVYVDNPQGELKPGMPADVILSGVSEW
jgi:HlyD family secretion protein